MNNPKLSLLASAAPSGVAFSFAGATFSPKPWGQQTVHSRNIRVKVECFFLSVRCFVLRNRCATDGSSGKTSEKTPSQSLPGQNFVFQQVGLQTVRSRNIRENSERFLSFPIPITPSIFAL